MTEQTIVVVTDLRYRHWKDYHLGIQISRSLIERVHPDFILIDPRHYQEQLGETGWKLQKLILAIPGVIELSILTHTLTVWKDDNVEWDNIEPLVLQVLKQFVGTPVEVVHVCSADVTDMHFHMDDSARPGFVMPQ